DLSNQVVELFPEFKEARDYLSEIAKQDLAKWREEHANLQKQNS
ncbi:MAG: hypothetical protein QG570_347, partial [Patescibacteria group bacterium]|nr:hypothetical protein [Patescibacteria group bacterium]